MAFTEAERNKIAASILGIRPIDLVAFLAFNAVNITAQVETDVRTNLDNWDANNLDLDFTQLQPNVANYGILDDPENLRQAIRNEICWLLGLDPSMVGTGGGGGMVHLQRA
jgi:hypothetical protein